MTTHRDASSGGFTLIEIVIIISVLAILAAAISPAILQQVVDTKIDTTKKEVRILHEAIVGRSDTPGSYGFVGDLGRVPVSIDELVKPRPGTPLYTTETVRGVGMGWKGPYINVGDTKDDYLNDAFGRPYRSVYGQIRSAGPDGVFDNEDDIVYPPSPPVVTGRVMVTIKRMSAEDTSFTIDPPNYEVRLHFSNNGQPGMLADNMAPFIFENVPQGIHAIEVIRLKYNQLVVADTIQTFGGGATKLVELFFRL